MENLQQKKNLELMFFVLNFQSKFKSDKIIFDINIYNKVGQKFDKFYILESLMQKNENCLCCKTYFEDGERLPLQDLVIQLKNYTYPIRDQKHRWIILKTIVSMLNSRGGTIFIGAEDKTGEVRGLTISRKQQDQFKLFIQKLTERIQPAVDLSNREDIIMQFLPVFNGETFTGRYVAKIIVKQGDPNKLYCFTQKIVLQSSTEKKYDEFEVVYSYKRINMGSVKELSSYEVVAQAAYRAANPPKIVNIFHQGCNPEPRSVAYTLSPSQSSPKYAPKPAEQIPSMDNLQLQESILQFTNIKDRETRQKLQVELDNIMDELGIKVYNSSYDEQNTTVLLQFTSKEAWNKAMDYIDENLEEINDNLTGHASFTKKQVQDDYAIYENEKGEFGSKDNAAEIEEIKEDDGEEENQRQRSLSPPTLKPKKQSIEEEIEKKEEKPGQEQFEIKIISEKENNKNKISTKKYLGLPSTVDITDTSILTITRLNPSRKQQLIEFLQSLIDCEKKIVEYDKTVEVIFNDKESFNKCFHKFEKSKDLAKFGFRGVLRFGVNVGQITLENYDRKKYRDFKTFITKLIGDDMKRYEFIKKGDKYTLVLTLKSSEKAAQWLDKLVANKDIKNFRLPGRIEAQKMKIDLVCVKPKLPQNE